MRDELADNEWAALKPCCRTKRGVCHVQGAGQAVFGDLVYDRETGQLTTGSFSDYAMPRAHDFCPFELHENPVPTASNPLGVKGAGETGTCGALPAVMNAVNDALASIGAPEIEMPATPEKTWRAIRLGTMPA